MSRSSGLCRPWRAFAAVVMLGLLLAPCAFAQAPAASPAPPPVPAVPPPTSGSVPHAPVPTTPPEQIAPAPQRGATPDSGGQLQKRSGGENSGASDGKHPAQAE